MSQTVRAGILAFARSHDIEEGHALQDERLALRLFDETARLGLQGLAGDWKSQQPLQSRPAPAEDQAPPRDLLSYAALLHDIGYVEGYESHHKTAFRLIMAAALPGLSPRDQAVIAHVARYHRGSLPDPAKHTAFAALPPEDRGLVEQLGALLRFADGLDRSHTAAVQDLGCALEGGALVVTLLPGRDDDSERWAGQKKARWFESVYAVNVVIR